MDITKRTDEVYGYGDYRLRPDGDLAEYLRAASEQPTVAFILGQHATACWTRWRVHVRMLDQELQTVLPRTADDAEAARRLEEAADYLVQRFRRLQEALR